MERSAVKWLEDIREEELALVGGKALNLGIMTCSSLPVPSGFVVTVEAYQAFVAHNGLASALSEAAVRLRTISELSEIDTMSETLRARFLAGEIPSDVLRSIHSAYVELCADSFGVAVRSSATAEDMPGASFAGQHDSYLSVTSESMLLDALRRCWGSTWSSRAITYRNTNGYEHSAVRMAVVVQRMVPAQASGILFTANPLNGDRTEMVINASRGLGEAVVGGEVNPDAIIIEKPTGSIKVVETGGDVPYHLAHRRPKDRANTPEASLGDISVSRAAIEQLRTLALRIESLFGTHMDIEWGLHDASVFILQARSITALPAEPLKWEAPGSGIWVHGGGIMEFQREPISPMTSSLIEGFFTPLYGEMTPFIRTAAAWPAVRVVNGHLYSCLTYHVRPWHLPWVAQLVLQHLRSVSRWQRELSAYVDTLDSIESQDFASLSSVEVVSRIAEAMRAFFRCYLQYASMVQMLTNTEERYISYYRREVMADGDPEPAFLLQGLETRITAAEDSLRSLADELRSDPSLNGALNDVRASSEPTTASPAVSAFHSRVRHHIATYGHQMYAFDFSVPTLGERRELVYETILAATTEPNDPRARRVATQHEQEIALQKIQERIGRRSWRQLERLLSRARRNLQTKEDAVFEIGRGIPVARAGFLELGTRLVTKEMLGKSTDVFWLTWQELQALARGLDTGNGMKSFLQPVEERQQRWRRFENVDAPTFLPLGRKPGWWLSHVMPLPELDKHFQGNELTGAAVSPGSVTGTARVIVDIDDMVRVKQGEILVTDATTPAWTPFFGRIGGLVTNRGGKLTHSSIVAREYGIPVVMGTVVATRRVQDGQQITVDGNKGVVRISPMPKEASTVETLTPL